MSFRKKALLATGVVATVGGIIAVLKYTEKGRALTQAAKERFLPEEPQYEEHVFVFKAPFDYEQECGTTATEVVYTKKISPKFVNPIPMTQNFQANRMNRQAYLQRRQQKIIALVKQGYTTPEIAKQLIMSVQAVDHELNRLKQKKMI